MQLGKTIGSLAFAGILWAVSGPALAVNSPGCVCPAGFSPDPAQANSCNRTIVDPAAPGSVPAICTSPSASTPTSKAILSRATALASIPYGAIDPADIATGGMFSGNAAAASGGSTGSHLGMYVTPPSGAGTGLTFGGGGYSLRNTGYGVSDTAGTLGTGSTTPGFHENGGSGGISGSYDASQLVGNNQKLIFSGLFNYSSSSATYGTTAPLLGIGVLNLGTVNNNVFQFGGSALYSNNTFYVLGKGEYAFGRGSETQSAALGAASGNYDINGYDVDLSLGNVFMLMDTTRSGAAPMYTKAPYTKAPPAVDGGYALGLDLSGHIGYQDTRDKGFTDSSGFIFGDETVKFGDGGLKAKLVASIPRDGVTWLPYVAGTVDWQFDFSHTSVIPSQNTFAGGDLISFTQATTVWGAQAGLDVRTSNGWTVGVNGFYASSSDTTVAGGRAFLRIPLGPATVAARY